MLDMRALHDANHGQYDRFSYAADSLSNDYLKSRGSHMDREKYRAWNKQSKNASVKSEAPASSPSPAAKSPAAAPKDGRRFKSAAPSQSGPVDFGRERGRYDKSGSGGVNLSSFDRPRMFAGKGTTQPSVRRADVPRAGAPAMPASVPIRGGSGVDKKVAGNTGQSPSWAHQIAQDLSSLDQDRRAGKVQTVWSHGQSDPTKRQTIWSHRDTTPGETEGPAVRVGGQALSDVRDKFGPEIHDTPSAPAVPIHAVPTPAFSSASRADTPVSRSGSTGVAFSSVSQHTAAGNAGHREPPRASFTSRSMTSPAVSRSPAGPVASPSFSSASSAATSPPKPKSAPAAARFSGSFSNGASSHRSI